MCTRACVFHVFSLVFIWLVFAAHEAQFPHDFRLAFHCCTFLLTLDVALDQTWLDLGVWLGTLKLSRGLFHGDEDEYVVAL